MSFNNYPSLNNHYVEIMNCNSKGYIITTLDNLYCTSVPNFVELNKYFKTNNKRYTDYIAYPARYVQNDEVISDSVGVSATKQGLKLNLTFYLYNQITGMHVKCEKALCLIDTGASYMSINYGQFNLNLNDFAYSQVTIIDSNNNRNIKMLSKGCIENFDGSYYPTDVVLSFKNLVGLDYINNYKLTIVNGSVIFEPNYSKQMMPESDVKQDQVYGYIN